MEFKRLRRSHRPPDGYRLAGVQDVKANQKMIEEEGIFEQWGILRLLDGSVSRDKTAQVGFRKCMDYMLVVKAENSAGNLLRKNLYRGITLSVEGKTAAFLLSCDDENTEVIYWILTATSSADDSRCLRQSFDNTFKPKQRRKIYYLQIVDKLLTHKKNIDWKEAMHYAYKLSTHKKRIDCKEAMHYSEDQNVEDALAFSELILRNVVDPDGTSPVKDNIAKEVKTALEFLVKEAAQRGYLKTVVRLLKLGVSLGAQPMVVGYKDDKTMLHYAAELGTDDDATNVTKLLFEKYEVGKELITMADKYGRSMLHLASLRGHVKLCEYIIKIKNLGPERSLDEVTDVEGKNPLHYAACGQHNKVVDLLLGNTKELLNRADKKGKTPLHVAAAAGNTEMVEKLLLESQCPENYARKTDFLGQTALHKAAHGGHEDIVTMLVNIVGYKYEVDRDVDGNTSLDLAVQFKDEQRAKDIAKLLLGKCKSEKEKFLLLWFSAIACTAKQSAGSNPNDTVKESAVSDGSIGKFLEEEKAKIEKTLINAPGSIEIKLLRMAAMIGNTDMTQELLSSSGADIGDIDDTAQLTVDEKNNVKKVIDDLKAICQRGYDQPAIIDNLGRADLAGGLAALLLNQHVKSPITVGIFGAWGTGKSSIMMQTERILLETAAFPHRFPAGKGIVPDQTGRRIYEKIKIFSKSAGAEGDLESSLYDKLYRSKHHAILKSLASMDRSHMFKRRDFEGSLWKYSGGPSNILTVFYNAWHYRDEHEAWAGLAVEITKEIESAMTTAQWLSTCYRYASTKEKGSFYLELILPSLITIMIAVGVVLVAWIVLSRLNDKQLSGIVKYGSIPATLVGVAWAVMKSVYSVLQPISTRMVGYMKFSGHEGRLGYQQDVISDIKFLKDEIRREPCVVSTFIACCGHWLRLWQDNIEGTSIRKMTQASKDNLRIVLFVDDLDRCQPNAILQVLSAINLVLAACEIDVVLGVDKDMIERAIKIEFQDKTNNIKEDWVDNYLSKIVQLPLSLPDPSSHESEKFLDGQLVCSRKLTPPELKAAPSQNENPTPPRTSVVNQPCWNTDGERGECSVNLGCCLQHESTHRGNDSVKDRNNNIFPFIKKIGDLCQSIPSLFRKPFTRNISEPSIIVREPPPLARETLTPSYSNGEVEALRYFKEKASDSHKHLREWKRFLNYHILVRYILFNRMKRHSPVTGWQVELVAWLFTCWQWTRQIYNIIQEWCELVKTELSLGQIVDCFIDDPCHQKSMKDNEQKTWKILREALRRYDVSMDGIQNFQQFRLHCKIGYLPPPKELSPGC